MVGDMTETFHAHLVWAGTARDFDLTMSENLVPVSAAPGFSGDPARVNPEQMLVGAVSACQALTFLALAARKQLAVVGYEDNAEGTLEPVEGRMRISRVTLRPRILLEGVPDDAGATDVLARAHALVERAHQGCFIANSISSAVTIEPVIRFHEAGATP